MDTVDLLIDRSGVGRMNPVFYYLTLTKYKPFLENALFYFSRREVDAAPPR